MSSGGKLILVGGGGHCKSVIEVAEQAGFEILGILDTPDKVGSRVSGYPVLGTDDAIADYVGQARFLVTVGQIQSPRLRIRLHERILQAGGELACVIASTAIVSSRACIEAGSVVMQGAIVNAGAKIGRGCIINTRADIEHDAHIGDFCHISTGAIVNGDCRVGRETFVGSGAVIANAVILPAQTLIGAGSVVIQSIHTAGTYVGNPARNIDRNAKKNPHNR